MRKEMMVLTWLAAMMLSVAANANPYYRVLGFKGSPFYKSAGFDISPRNPIQTVGVWNVGLVTHSNGDGSLCDKLKLGAWCVPESWVPIQASVGGSFSDQMFAGAGTSFNAAPQIGALIFNGVNKSSSQFAQSVKAAFAGTSSTNFRIGADFLGSVVQDGHFVNAKAAFPGRGPWAVLSNAARLNVGLAW